MNLTDPNQEDSSPKNISKMKENFVLNYVIIVNLWSGIVRQHLIKINIAWLFVVQKGDLRGSKTLNVIIVCTTIKRLYRMMHFWQQIKLDQKMFYCLLKSHIDVKYSLYTKTYTITSIHSIYTGTQLIIAIVDARSIANASYYGVMYARPGLLRMRRSTSPALER